MSADLLARLIEAGTPAALVAEVAMLLATSQASANAMEIRRVGERKRQAKHRKRLPADWHSRRQDVFARDGYTCRYCGAKGVPLECDHVHPLSRGGSHDLDNLATACKPCNAGKRDRTPAEWRR